MPKLYSLNACEITINLHTLLSTCLILQFFLFLFRELLQDILREIESRDTNLSLITHGFSPLIIRAVIDILIEIITFHEA